MYFLVLILGTVPGPVLPASDSTLTLAAAHALALERNPRIRAARSAVAAAEAGVRQAGAARDPQVVFAREQTGETAWQNTALIDQPIELFGQRSSRARSARARVGVAEQALAATTRAVQSEVSVAFAAAQTAERQMTLADSLLAAFRRAETILEARLREGDASGYEVRRLRLEAARYLGTRAEAESRRTEALGSLDLLLGRHASDPPIRPVGGFRIEPPGLTRDSLARLAAGSDGRAAVAAAAAEAARFDLIRLRRERIPVISLGLGYMEVRSGSADRASGYLAQLSLPVPLWGSRGSAVAAGTAEAERLNALADEAAAVARRDALTAADRAQALARHHSALQSRLGAEAAVSLNAAEVAFSDGEMTLIEWLDAMRAHYEAAALEAGLVAEFVARMAELERLTGLTLIAR